MGVISSARKAGQNAVRQSKFNRLKSRLLSLFSDTRFIPHDGYMPFNPQYPSVLVVSHEASVTGAPVLALNVCQHLCPSNNVVVLLMKGGPLVEDYQQYSVRVLEVSVGHLDKYRFLPTNGVRAPAITIRSEKHAPSNAGLSNDTTMSPRGSKGPQRKPVQVLLHALGFKAIKRYLWSELRRRLLPSASDVADWGELLMTTLLAHELKQPGGQQLPRYALVNTLVAAPWIGPLRSLRIAPITLIHEFSAYTRPIGLINLVGLLSSELVFSSDLTRRDASENYPLLLSRRMHVHAQGPCNLPERLRRQHQGQSSLDDEASRFLRELTPETILIVGAGAVQPRKGVDHFISVADQMRVYCPNQRLQFVWIGSGYDPINDFYLGLWLKDQIERSGLNSQLHIFDQSPAYEELLRRANLFLLSSRLDPLPNVAIDALNEGKVVLCFNKTCGIAELLLSDAELGEACVAPYLNIATMARQAAALVNDPGRLVDLGSRAQQLAKSWFDMPTYIRSLQSLGERAALDMKELYSQLDRLVSFDAIDWSYSPWDLSLSTRACTENYLLSWRNWSTPRKPFCGFHPGIYKQEVLLNDDNIDPLLHYLESGKPHGPWTAPLITPGQEFKSIDADVKVALHIHVHYPELLAPIIEALAANKIRPHLFISTSHREYVSELHHQVECRGMTIRRLIIVPNRGRDIGPLLTELGHLLDQEYTFYGHIHTKKSVLAHQDAGRVWRDYIIANLLGDAHTLMADRILAAMNADPHLGLVFPDDPHCMSWGHNYEPARLLAIRLGLTELPEAFNCPVGTMFWARQGALLPLYALRLGWEDYPEEPLSYDGTLLHAIERLIPVVTQSQGYSYSLTSVPGVRR